MFETPLGQKRSDLYIGIDARFDLAEELQDVLIAVNDRRIALLRARD